MTFYSKRDRALYVYAIKCALSALTGYAVQRGHGWYHLADGELITVTEICLGRNGSLGSKEILTVC